MTRLVAMSILTNQTRDVRRSIGTHLTGNDEERVELGHEFLFIAEELHESVNIMRHQPGILPCISLGIVIFTMLGREWVERNAELAVGTQTAHKAGLLVEVLAVSL